MSKHDFPVPFFERDMVKLIVERIYNQTSVAMPDDELDKIAENTMADNKWIELTDQIANTMYAYKPKESVSEIRKKPEFVSNGLVNVPDINIEYKGFNIIPKRDFGKYPYSNVNTYRKGYVIVKDGVNVMAGGAWATSVIQAKSMIDSHIEANGNAELFWKIHRSKQGLDEWEEV